MKTILSRLNRRAAVLSALGLLCSTLVACGQPQSTDTAVSSPAASTIAVAEQASSAPISTTQPTAEPTVMPTAQPTDQPTSSPAAMSGAGHDHMASGAPMAAQPDAEVAANIQLFMFSPEPLEIPLGTTVVWTNQDDIEHSVTSGTAPTADMAFDSDFFTKGQTYSFTFSEAGQFAYFCKRHPSMIGMVNVLP